MRISSVSIVAVEAAQPAIEGLPADAEVSAGACGIPSVKEIKSIH
jgi:hypothetical protein